jgi:hypothetical protein
LFQVRPCSARTAGIPSRSALHLLVDPAVGEGLADALELQDLHDVDRGEAAAHDDGAVDDVVVRSLVPALGEVVEPVDQRVLVDEALPDVLLGARDRERPVVPGAVRQDDGREPPFLDERFEVEVAADLRVRDEVDARATEPRVDGVVLLAAELHVPAGKPVLDLPVRAGVLLEDDGGDATTPTSRPPGAGRRPPMIATTKF